MKGRLIAIAVFLAGLSMPVLAQGLIYDGMATYKSAVVKPDVQAIFEKDVFPVARKHFKSEADCDESFKIDDGAAIQVDTNYSEKIYLYTYCGDPFSNSYQGIAVIKNGKVSEHFVFGTFVLHFDSIFYKNGLAVLAGTGTKHNSDWGTVTAIDWTSSSHSQSSFFSYDNSCNDNGEKCVLTAQKIFAEFADGGYWFSTEGYQKRNGQWVKTKAKKDVTNVEPEAGLKEVLLDWNEIK